MAKNPHSAANKALRRLLIEAREGAGLTQQALADRLSRSQSFVAKYEGGERRLDVVEFVQVARAIGTDPAKIVKILSL
jgi:transcriptional regulator with XRE-family HTH domain